MAYVTHNKQMTEVLLELYNDLNTEVKANAGVATELQKKHFDKIHKLLVDINVIQICSACENIFTDSELQKRTGCCNQKSFFCKTCVKRHDRECDKFNENLEKIKEEKEHNYREKIKVETRMSAKMAADQGMVKCSCKRYFVPEIRVLKNKEVPYKSCKVCRDKRKKPKDEVRQKEKEVQPGEDE
jgi:hypothetical protein